MNEDDQPSLEQLIGRYGPPPLRISHILLATTVAAVLLSLAKLIVARDVPGFAKFLSSGLGIYYVLATSIAVTLVMLGIRWRYEGRSFFDQPGHGLLVLQSSAVGTFVSAVIGLGPMTVYMFLSYPFVFGVCVYFVLKVADSSFWKLYFIIYGLQGPAMLLLGISLRRELDLLILFIPLSLLGSLVTATIGDRLKGRKRDWPHWIGVVLKLGIYSFEATRQVLSFV